MSALVELMLAACGLATGAFLVGLGGAAGYHAGRLLGARWFGPHGNTTTVYIRDSAGHDKREGD